MRVPPRPGDSLDALGSLDKIRDRLGYEVEWSCWGKFLGSPCQGMGTNPSKTVDQPATVPMWDPMSDTRKCGFRRSEPPSPSEGATPFRGKGPPERSEATLAAWVTP